MEITDEMLEWATVGRMRDMILKIDDDYEVTHSYALFTAILCWVMQRIRSTGTSPIDRRAQSVLVTLENELITSSPWRIATFVDGDPKNIRDITQPVSVPGFEGFTVSRFLTTLRNAAAHGDARNITPVNRNQVLIGHNFHCSESENGKVVWRGNIILDGATMRRIGAELAHRFCDALASRDDGNVNPNFEVEAKSIREKAA